MTVFQEKNLIVPSAKEMWAAMGCWVLDLIALPLLFSLFPFFREDSLRAQFLYDLSITVCSFIIILFCFRKFLFRSRLPFNLLALTCLFGFLGARGLEAFCGIFLSFFVSFLPEDALNMNQELVNSFLESYSLPMIINVALLTPFIEELLFRGSLFGPMCKKSPFLAYIVSMILFAGLHVVSFIGIQHWSVLLFSFVQYLPAGFVLGWCYQRSHSIWPPIVLHGLLNLFSSFMILA